MDNSCASRMEAPLIRKTISIRAFTTHPPALHRGWELPGIIYARDKIRVATGAAACVRVEAVLIALTESK